MFDLWQFSLDVQQVRAVRLGEASFGNIYRWDGESGHLVATYNTLTAFAGSASSNVERSMTNAALTHQKIPTAGLVGASAEVGGDY
jgi:hypothetical protein